MCNLFLIRLFFSYNHNVAEMLVSKSLHNVYIGFSQNIYAE